MSQRISESTSQVVTQRIRAEYLRLDREGVESIAPDDLAMVVYLSFDPERASPIEVRHLAHLELKQQARKLLANKRKQDAEAAQFEFTDFDEDLQTRYPTKRNGVDAYVRRDMLSLSERSEWIARERAEAGEKLRHARLLEEETRMLVARGYFDVDGIPYGSEAKG